MNAALGLRGERIRAWLLAIARGCFQRGEPMPTIPELSDFAGICDEQVARHIRRLIKEGAIRTRKTRRRRYVEEVRL
jgi:DNA-binding transcriptional regulator YhcF (GntR family)